MADPAANTAGGLAPQPPPLPQTEASDTGAARTPRARSQEKSVVTDAESCPPILPVLPTPSPSPSRKTTAVADATVSPPTVPVLPPPSRKTAVVDDDESHPPTLPLPPSRDTAVAAADVESHPPALPIPPPPPPQEQRQQDDDTDKNGKEINRRKSRWTRVRSPMLMLLELFRHRLQRPSHLIHQPKITPPPSQKKDGDAPYKGAVEKDQSEGSNRRLQDASMSASGRIVPPVPDGGIAADTPNRRSSTAKKHWNVLRWIVKTIIPWYQRHRQPEKADKLPGETPSTSAQEVETKKSKQDVKEKTKEPHPRWPEEEGRLEKILEEACTRMLAAEFSKLGDQNKRNCLLTFSFFPVGHKVKKQAVTYWWATQFNLLPKEQDKGPVDSAAQIFRELSDAGFLEPIKNRCSEVIHGCSVNPLVHWMVKQHARKDFADLDDRGNPPDQQPKSKVFCLTKENRAPLLESKGQARTMSLQAKKASMDPQEAEGPNKIPKKEIEEKPRDAVGSEKKIILNVSAHVYKLPEGLFSEDIAKQLEVLQLGRWRNTDDDDKYMEVLDLDKLSDIGKFENLRYLSLRGLSRLTELPKEVRRLQKLAILDMRGCQNLVRVSSAAVGTLKALTHLDLTECYMLEHISKGVTALLNLRVFKGFVFSVEKQRRRCTLKDLMKLDKLQKLSINVTTYCNVSEGEMANLEHFKVRSLTVTWGELPSILVDDHGGRIKLLTRWTKFVLPAKLEKLDVRCYPDKKLPDKWLKGLKSIKKLYVRGGELNELDILEKENNMIEILRLRYLNQFNMDWNTLYSKLPKTIKRVEVVDKDEKVTRNERKQGKDEQKRMTVEGCEDKSRGSTSNKEPHPIKERMEIGAGILDETRVWVRDDKEDQNADKVQTDGKGHAPENVKAEVMLPNKQDGGDTRETKNVGGGDENASKAQIEIKDEKGDVLENANAEVKPTNKEDGGDTGEVKNVDDGYEKGREVKEEQGNTKKVAKENVKFEAQKETALSASTASDEYVNDGADVDKGATYKSNVPELPTDSEDNGIVPIPTTALRTKADNSSTDVLQKSVGKGGEDDDDDDSHENEVVQAEGQVIIREEMKRHQLKNISRKLMDEGPLDC